MIVGHDFNACTTAFINYIEAHLLHKYAQRKHSKLYNASQLTQANTEFTILRIREHPVRDEWYTVQPLTLLMMTLLSKARLTVQKHKECRGEYWTVTLFVQQIIRAMQ